MHVFIKKYALHHFTCDFTIYFTIDMCRFRTSCGFPTVGMLISPMPAALRLQRSGRVWNWTVVPSDVSLSTQFLHAQAPYPVLTSATFISKFERCWRCIDCIGAFCKWFTLRISDNRHPKFEVPRAVLLRIHGLVCMTPEQKNAVVHGVIITFSVCRLLIGSVRLLGQGLNPTKICLKMRVLTREWMVILTGTDFGQIFRQTPVLLVMPWFGNMSHVAWSVAQPGFKHQSENQEVAIIGIAASVP